MKKYLILAAIAAGVAVIFGASTAATLSLAPRFNLGLVERLICAPGERLDYQESAPYTLTDSQGTRRVASFSIDCVAPDGTRTGGKEGITIGTLMGVYFLFFFVLLYGLGVWMLMRWFPSSPRSSSLPKKA